MPKLGCIPTKALLRTAEIKHLIDNASDFGLKVANASVDLNAVVTRSRNVAKQLSSGISHLMKKNKIDVFMTSASLGGVTKGLREVVLEDKNIEGKKTSFWQLERVHAHSWH